LPLVKALGGTVVLETRQSLVPLFKDLAGTDAVVVRRGDGSPSTRCDMTVALMSLPRLLGTGIETIPRQVPYLFADPGRTPANVARDGFRNPKETLSFFGLAPGMRVIELAPGGGWYSCVKGSEFNGTQCEKVPTEPTPPTPTPKPGDTCVIGEKMWCDGLQYCGWGQVMCDPKTNKWKTKLDSNGKEILDCNELATGERPNTVCACFHFFFNPSCCERPDCIVPPGTNGQICPASAGGLCDYCNPQKSECKEAQAKCIVTNAHETFCGRLCSTTAPCPNGYQCMVVKLNGGQSTNQCVPADYSCYY